MVSKQTVMKAGQRPGSGVGTASIRILARMCHRSTSGSLVCSQRRSPGGGERLALLQHMDKLSQIAGVEGSRRDGAGRGRQCRPQSAHLAPECSLAYRPATSLV